MDKISENVRKQLEQFKAWVKTQANFPPDLDDDLLLRFLHSCYYDMEKAKAAAELFVTIRSTTPELFTNRDPSSPFMKKMLQILNLAQYEISGNRVLWIWQLNDPGLETYDYLLDAKVFTTMVDAWLLSSHELEEGDIVIMDVKDISLKFLAKFNVSIARKLSKYQEEAMPIRLKQIHVVNTPPFIDKLYTIMKPFLKQETLDMIHFHTPNAETLNDFFSKDELPADFGGTKMKMEEYMKKSMVLLDDKRTLLQNNTLWRTDKKSKNKPDFSTEVGSFRTLAID